MTTMWSTGRRVSWPPRMSFSSRARGCDSWLGKTGSQGTCPKPGGGHVVALVLVLALILTGCQVRFPSSTDPLVKIGLIAPFEGRLRARGYDVLYAVKLAVRQWNEAGGVNGYRVELVALDDGGDPAMAAQQARELTVDRDVLGVIGHFTEEATLAAVPEYVAQRLVLVAPGVGVEGITTAGGVVRLGLSYRLLGRQAAQYALEVLLVKRLAVLRGEGDLADAFVAVARQLGGSVVVDEFIKKGDWLSRLVDASPDLVFLPTGAMAGAKVIRRAREAGVEAVFLGGPALGDRTLVQVAGLAVEGTLYLAAAPAGSDLGNGAAFVADYQILAGHLPDPRATLAYEATNLLLEAIARAEGELSRRPSREAVWDQLTAGGRYDGLLGTWMFSSGEPREWPAAIYRIESGNYPGQRVH